MSWNVENHTSPLSHLTNIKEILIICSNTRVREIRKSKNLSRLLCNFLFSIFFSINKNNIEIKGTRTLLLKYDTIGAFIWYQFEIMRLFYTHMAYKTAIQYYCSIICALNDCKFLEKNKFVWKLSLHIKLIGEEIFIRIYRLNGKQTSSLSRKPRSES